ncbi:MAG TPA: hypothetical protein VF297_26560 [Pyrinomonadaceae bacterium]
MFTDLIEFPIESPKLKWEAKVVVREINEGPRLYVRLKLTGTRFPIFNTIPFVRIGRTVTHHVDIADDGLSANAYFAQAPPEGGVVEFGYDVETMLRFPRRYSGDAVTRLDQQRLPKALQYQDRLFREEIG